MHDAYMRCQEGRFPRPALTNGRPGTGLLVNSREVARGRYRSPVPRLS